MQREGGGMGGKEGERARGEGKEGGREAAAVAAGTMGDFANNDLFEMPRRPLVTQIPPVGPDRKPIQVPDLRLHQGEAVGLAAQEEAVGLGGVRREPDGACCAMALYALQHHHIRYKQGTTVCDAA